MSNRRTELRHHSRDGQSLQLTSQDSDSPILPVSQLRLLHEFRPDLVDWVVKRTEEESIFRRSRQNRIDGFVFVERIGGMVGGGTLVSILGIIVSGRNKPLRPNDEESAPKKG